MHPFFKDFKFAGFVHRGGAEEVVENTLEAFKYSSEMGFTFMETDVQCSKDGHVVVFHDEDLERMAGMKKKICDLSYREINGIILQGGLKIPSLNELLSSFKDLRFNIDVKADEALEGTVQIVKDHKALNRVCFASFSSRRLDQIRNLAGPNGCTSMGTREILQARIGSFGIPLNLSSGYCAQVPLSQWGLPLVTVNFINYLKKKGKLIHVWTIDEDQEMKRLISMGVNGIMTDKPKVLKRVLIESELM